MNELRSLGLIRDVGVFKLYIIAFLFLCGQSIHVWFLWGNLFKVLCPILFMGASLLNRSKNCGIYSRKQYLHIVPIIVIIAFIALRSTYDAGILSISKALIGVYALYDLLILGQEVGIYIIRLITKLFGIVTIISLTGWILFLLGIPLPNNYIVDTEFGYTFNNYYIFLHNQSLLIPRFCSVFLEPGYYGQLAALILFANKMRFNNKYTIAIAVGVLFSLSLAGYVLVGIGLIFTYFKKKLYLPFIILLFIGYCSIEFIKKYNGGDNPINILILSRLEFEDGEMVGYNRSGEDFDLYMKTKFLQDGNALFGLGSSFEKMQWDHGVAGYKVYIAQNGYLGLLLAIIAYWLTIKRNRRATKDMKLFFLLIMILYWQAAYPFWFCYFALFVTGLAHLRTDNYFLILKH